MAISYPETDVMLSRAPGSGSDYCGCFTDMLQPAVFASICAGLPLTAPEYLNQLRRWCQSSVFPKEYSPPSASEYPSRAPELNGAHLPPSPHCFAGVRVAFAEEDMVCFLSRAGAYHGLSAGHTGL